MQVALVESHGEGEEQIVWGVAAATSARDVTVADTAEDAWRAMLHALAAPRPGLFAVSLAPVTLVSSEVLARIRRDPEAWLVPVIIEPEAPLPGDAITPVPRDQLPVAIEGVQRFFARRVDAAAPRRRPPTSPAP